MERRPLSSVMCTEVDRLFAAAHHSSEGIDIYIVMEGGEQSRKT